MKTLEYTQQTGKIRPFHIEREIEELIKLDDNKPSKRIITTKKGRKAIAVLMQIEQEHNTSWYQELLKRSKRNPNAIALVYRGNKITFKEMFKTADKFAKSLKTAGINKGDEIPCCLANTPELIYTMLAANKIGAKLNLFGTHLDKGYLKSILDSTTNKIFIASDDNYGQIKDVVENCDFKKKVVFSLADSLLEDPTVSDEYVSDLDKYYHYENLAVNYKKEDSTIMTKDEFISSGAKYNEEIIDEGTLDTEFLVTYTSGSTKKGFPKQIIHSNRSLIVSGTFNDMELSGSPEIPYQRGMCYIHSESNTNLVTCISDSLMKLWSVACEPEYGKEVALNVIRINNPSMIEMTTSHLIQMAKDYLKMMKKGVKYKFPNMIATFAVGEPTSKGEEKLLNKVLRLARAGSEVRVKGITIPFAPLSVGGGDCEHGGIFYNVFNAIKTKKNMLITRRKDNTGMAPVVFGNVTAMKRNAQGQYEECNYDEYGIIVANTATNMVGYKDNKEKTLKKIIRDENGRDWLSCDVYGYIDKAGNVHQKDRVGNEIYLKSGAVVLPSQIAEVVQSDTKNILSCSVTPYHSEDGDMIVINYELSPLRTKSAEKAILSMNERIVSKFGNILGDSIVYREFSEEESYPLNGSGKRDNYAIENMGLYNTFKIKNNHIEHSIDFIDNNSGFDDIEFLEETPELINKYKESRR